MPKPAGKPAAAELAGPLAEHPPAGRLQGRVCLVAGATRGIGRATALRMAEEGAAAVVVSGRNQQLGIELAAELHELGAESLFVSADVTKEAELAKLVERTVEQFGRLDAVCNNAGVQEKRALLAEQTPAAYDLVFDTNVRFLFDAMRY
jgi:NAD(P)-dependent dehydrogenase (short-subunit alcohol dehydrogenase family)